MNVCVHGLWHLGVVTAACLAEKGHRVVALDRDVAVVDALRRGRLPVAEPGLDELVLRNLAAGRLTLATDPRAACDADVLWVAGDTPVDAADVADVERVMRDAQAILPHVRDGATILVSSQLPVGSVARLERWAAAARPGARLSFACSPENLRLGKAIQAFLSPDRVVVGVRGGAARARVAELLAPITDRIEWMSVESAEMTKHALNAFLAVSVTFANEIAAVCEAVGADAKEVERGLKSDSRIGARAYLAPGSAFAGGTLARDVAFLASLAAGRGVEIPLLGSVRPSNERHKGWALRLVRARVPPGAAVAIWGLTYKPGTDTLRRSAAVELCLALAASGYVPRAHDPAVGSLPSELGSAVQLCGTAADALRGTSALVVATEWPEFRTVDLAAALPLMKRPLVLDANRFLLDRLAGLAVEYQAVGAPGPAEVSDG